MERDCARTVSEGGADGVRFLFEEYKNVAATHDKLRDVIIRIFNYFLLLSAAPFTVAGVMYQAGGFNLLQAPPSMHILFLVVGAGHLFLALTILDARLSQYRYARTVNAIRQYFAETHREIAPYLYLPTDRTNPPFTRLGYVGIQLRLVWPSALSSLATVCGESDTYCLAEQVSSACSRSCSMSPFTSCFSE